jgi:hypothetical protein
MNDFEDRLKRLPICKPSRELRERIFGKETPQSALRSILHGRIPVAWAAAVSIVMGFVGFFIAFLWIPATQPGAPPARAASMNVQIIYQAPQASHVFDFTEAAIDFLPGDVNVQVKSHGEV